MQQSLEIRIRTSEKKKFFNWYWLYGRSQGCKFTDFWHQIWLGFPKWLVFPVYFVDLALRKKRISEHYCCKYKRCHSGFSFSWLSPFIYCISRSSHRRCSVKKVFLKISQISQESTCVRVSFWQSCRPSDPSGNFIKKRLKHRCFPVKFTKFVRTPILRTKKNMSWIKCI